MKTQICTSIRCAIQGFAPNGAGFTELFLCNIPHGDGSPCIYAALPGGGELRIGSSPEILAAIRAAIAGGMAPQSTPYKGGGWTFHSTPSLGDGSEHALLARA